MSSIRGKYGVPAEIKTAYEEAAELSNRGEYKKARRILLELVKVYPGEPRLLNSLGNTFARTDGEKEKAVEYYRRALEIAPDLAPALNNLSALYSALGRYEESAEYARRAIKADRESPVPWNTLGLYYARKGDVKTGLEYFLASFSYGGGYRIAAYNAACALTELGRAEEALGYLEKSLYDVRLYHDALKDPVLDPLRDIPEFGAIMAEAAERFEGPPD